MVLLLPTHEPQLIAEQDDSSISSTLTVDRQQKSKPAAEQQPPKDGSSEKKKRVHFNMSHNIAYTNTTSAKEDCPELWYRVKDYRVFRAVALDSAQQIIRIEARNRAPFSYQRVMELTYRACCDADSEFDYNNDEREQPCVLASSEFVHLQRWLEVASSRCGLEKWSVRKIAKDKQLRRNELTDSVLELQSVFSGSTEKQQNDKDEFIRSSCENISRPSRMFARTLAQAQAAAVQKTSDEEQ
jgi:hypothetical protein